MMQFRVILECCSFQTLGRHFIEAFHVFFCCIFLDTELYFPLELQKHLWNLNLPQIKNLSTLNAIKHVNHLTFVISRREQALKASPEIS